MVDNTASAYTICVGPPTPTTTAAAPVTTPRSTRDQDQYALPAAPVGQRRQQGGQDRGRGHAKQSHQPDGCRATVSVGHDPEPDGERPLGRPGSQEAELGAP